MAFAMGEIREALPDGVGVTGGYGSPDQPGVRAGCDILDRRERP
jgi:hypothetical protein